jgi:hypothetical protein
MSRMDFSPRFTSPLSSNSPTSINRGAKRSRSRTFSSQDDPQRDLSAIRTRGLSSGSTYLPTPPLSASSSSSGSSFNSNHSGHFPSFANFQWRPESAGPPMTQTLHESPEGYVKTPAPEVHLDAIKELDALKGFYGRPSSCQPTPPPLLPLDAARFIANKALNHSTQPPKAPLLEPEANPIDGMKPWLQQEYVEGLIGARARGWQYFQCADSFWSDRRLNVGHRFDLAHSRRFNSKFISSCIAGFTWQSRSSLAAQVLYSRNSQAQSIQCCCFASGALLPAQGPKSNTRKGGKGRSGKGSVRPLGKG